MGKESNWFRSYRVLSQVYGDTSFSSSASSVSSPTSSSSLSSSSIVTCSTSLPVAFNDKSTNSGLVAGELLPDLHVSSKSLTVATHALYWMSSNKCCGQNRSYK